MDKDFCWQAFWETGAPELYLLCRACDGEDTTCKQEKS